MGRAENRRWEKEHWPYWERLIRFKCHAIKPKWQRRGRPWYVTSEPRSSAEIVDFIDHLLKDLGETP